MRKVFFENNRADWEEKCLDELGVITSSKRIYKSEYVKDGVPFYRTKEIKELSNGKELSLELFISNERYDEIKRSFGVPQINDLLMSAVGTIGEIMVIENNDEFYFKDGNILWFKEFNCLDTNYLKYALTAFVEEIKNLAIGAAYSALTIEKLNKYKISFPKTKHEQQRIVSILDEVFAAIATAKANAEQNLKNAKELFESYLQGVFENKGEGWDEKKLNEVCELKPQKKEARDKLKETDMVTFLPMEDLGVLNKEIVGVKERQLKDVAGSYTYFANNDVLLAKITPCFENGKIGIARNLINGIGFGSSEYIVLRTKGNIKPEYLYYFLSRTQIREEGRKYMSGAVGHKRVSKDWIENYYIPFPKSLKEQQMIIDKMDSLSSETRRLEAIYQQKINSLEELKMSILQKAFSGELKTLKAVLA